MTKSLTINRRGWLATWLQRRRRARAALHSAPPIVVPNAPVFTNSGFEWDETQEGWADTFFDWTFDHGSLPVASIEIWLARDNNGLVDEQVTTVPSTTGSYRHAPATQGEDFLHYKLRYVNGGTVGPFSSEVVILVEEVASMALTLIKEDGTGKADANAYASAADGDAYHQGHLYPDAWEAATADRKVRALVMATRVIDAEYQFNGFKAKDGQALQWPRFECRDPDGTAPFWPLSGALSGVLLSPWRNVSGAAFLPSDEVPKAVVEATCEMAREFLITDRTAAPAGEGIKYQNVGTTQTGYDKSDTRPVISHVVQAMLAKYGALLNGKSGTVKLERV